jgi:hypothetical protein
MENHIFWGSGLVGCSWNDASSVAVDRIWGGVSNDKMVVRGVADLRAFLDAAIGLDFEHEVRSSEARLASWRDIGVADVKLASLLGYELSPAVVKATLVRKQADYGHENIRRFGERGLFVRLHDKVARLENLLARDAAPKNESLSDNFLDVVGYCAIGCMWVGGVFLLPLV